jgi:hypothetical protein
MRAKYFAAVILLLISSSLPVSASIYDVPGGLAVQVNEGQPIPPPATLTAMSNRHDDVRDILGWPDSEKSAGNYALPVRNAAFYSEVAAAGRDNVVTLFGCNTAAPYKCYGKQSFPQTAAQIKGFVNWACWVVSAANIPNLRAITIWNEMNGTFNGGIQSPPAQQQAMANLLVALVPAVRECNPNVAVYAGAFVGDSSLPAWFCHIQEDGFDWSLVDGLDIHPYLAAGPNAKTQDGQDWQAAFAGPKSLLSGCQGQTKPIVRPLYFSEWGGYALQAALANGNVDSAADYFAWFEANVANVNPVSYPVVGRAYFLLANYGGFSLEGLFLADFVTMTSIGAAYENAYIQH